MRNFPSAWLTGPPLWQIELTAEEVSQLEALAANVVGERGNDYYMSKSHETLDKKSQQ